MHYNGCDVGFDLSLCPSEKPSARGGGAKDSQKAEAADSAPSTSASQSQQPVIVEVLMEVSVRTLTMKSVGKTHRK